MHWTRCWDLERVDEEDDIIERSYTCGGVESLQELFFTRGSTIDDEVNLAYGRKG